MAVFGLLERMDSVWSTFLRALSVSRLKFTKQLLVAIVLPTVSFTTTCVSASKYPYWERLDNGVNIERSEYSKITDAELKYLHNSGVENLRLFMTPEEYLTKGKPMDPAHNGFVQGVLSLAERANKAGLAVIIDPLAHNLFFRDNPNDQAAITMEVNWWKELASTINTRFDPKDIFLEVTNEPMLQHAEDWWKIQAQFISVMRAAAPDFTIIAASNMRDVSMGNQWDQIGALDDDEALCRSQHCLQRPLSTGRSSSRISRRTGYPRRPIRACAITIPMAAPAAKRATAPDVLSLNFPGQDHGRESIRRK